MSRLSVAVLYAILDTGYSSPDTWPELLPKLIRGGVDVVQVRAKGRHREEIARWAEPLIPIAHESHVPLIINDYPDLVPILKAAGCHVGQEDGSVADARQLAGTDALVGKSTHSLQQACDAANEKPDYIAYGPLFATPTKPDYVPVGLVGLADVQIRTGMAPFCIGGIKWENLPAVVGAGARRVVIVSGLLLSGDPEGYARRVKDFVLENTTKG